MATTFTLPDTAIPIGDTVFGPFTVPSGVIAITLQQATARLPDTGSILAEAQIETSPDGIVPFTFYASTGIIGGVIPVTFKNPTGTLNTRFEPWPYATASKVRIRCHAYVAFTLTDLQIVLT